MKSKIAAALIAAFVGTPAVASDPFEEAKQKAAAEANAATEAIRSRAGTAHWQVRQQKSPMDDSLSVRLDTVSPAMYRDRYGREKPIILTIMCHENRTNVHQLCGAFYERPKRRRARPVSN